MSGIRSPEIVCPSQRQAIPLPSFDLQETGATTNYHSVLSHPDQVDEEAG